MTCGNDVWPVPTVVFTDLKAVCKDHCEVLAENLTVTFFLNEDGICKMFGLAYPKVHIGGIGISKYQFQYDTLYMLNW